MKLHLPVQLFRAVIALMAVAMPFSASADQKYTVADGQQLTLSGWDRFDLDISEYSWSSSSSDVYGGAIYATGTGSITIEHNVNLLFNENFAEASKGYDAFGGAIYSDSGAITLSGNGSVTFSGNYSKSSATSSFGGAIYSYSGSITLSENESITFSGNYASSFAGSLGGAIFSYSGSITLSGNGSVTFSGNYTSDDDSYGGAIYSSSGAITLSENESVTFSGNYAHSDDASSSGGAIYSYSGDITLGGNGSVTFSGNYAYSDDSYSDSYGGAIYSKNGDITLSGNGSVTFSGNHAKSSATSDDFSSGGAIYSGAVYSQDGAITLSGNGSVTFSDNYATSSGGAIYSEEGAITLSENGSVTFSDNYATSVGGAIDNDSGAITLSGNGSVTFSDNYATYASGGAIYSSSGAITLSGNESVTFSGNYAYYYGGAICSNMYAITLSGNESVTFSGNYASSSGDFSYGGAIWSSIGAIRLSENGSVTFSGNYVSSSYYYPYGGAIYGKNIYIRDNGSVIFKQNYETRGSTYRLRGLYAEGNTALSSASGNYIEFQESMYVGGKLELNNIYTNKSGKSVAQTGDIIFTGAYSAEHLGAIKRKYTAEELNNSRTSNVSGMTTLYDGRLIVRDGAILSGAGLTVASSASGNSTPTVLIENAKLNHAGATVSFASGTRLEARGQSEIDCNNLTMASGSALTLHATGENMRTAVLRVYGSFMRGGSLTLNISFNDTEAEAGTYKLLHVAGSINFYTWTADKITVNGLDGTTVNFEDLYWADKVLWLTYSGNIPELTVATWSNESGDGEWNTSSMNWAQDSYDYAYVDGVAVVFGDTGAGEVKLVGNLTPSSVLVDSSADYTWSGDGCICGATSLTKQGSGTLTINNANSYTGGTIINGGIIVVNNASSLGTGKVFVNGGTLEIGVSGFTNAMSFAGNSCLAIGAGITYAIQASFSNNGSLTLSGSFKADALSKELTGVDVRVDVNGNEGGTSGFLRTGDFTVTLANGSVNSSNASVSYKGQALSMNGGVGFGKGTVDYSNYLLTDGNSASVSDISDAANGALEDITMTGGKLTVDDSVVLDATGGNITITADSTLSGSMVDADITTAEGEYENTISAGLSGDSSLTVNGGTITVTGDNTYTGGTIINGGMLNVGSDTSLGSGDVTLNKGTLDLGDFAVGNDILATGGTLSGADNYGGKLTVNGDVVLDGDIVAQGGIELNGGSISGGGIVDTDVTIHTEGYTDVDFDITGDSSLTINGGDVIITGGNNDYTGGTTLNGGSLTIGSTGTLGSGVVTLNGGVLNTNETELTNDIVNNGGTVVSNYVLDKGRTLTIGADGATFVGDIVLSGGLLYFEGMPLTVNGKVSGGDAPVSVHVTGYSVIDMDGTVTLAEFGNDVQGITNSSFVNTGYGNLSYDATNHTLNLTLTNKNIWVGGKGANWVHGLNAGWQNYETFEAGNRVVFNTKGTVKIVGDVEPASVLVDIEKSLTFKTSYNRKTGLYSGAIVGNGCVVKRGKGMLTLNDGNEYTGGTFIEAGTVKAKGATSFGTGAITLLGGAVDLSSKAVANDIVLAGSAAVKKGKKYTGEFTMNSGELLKGSLINVADSAELQSGVVNGTLSGVGTVAVNGNVTLGSSGKITTNALEVDGSLTVAKALSMNSKASAITIDGGMLSSAGKISAYGLSMEGGKLDVTNGKPMSITLKGAFSATDGADIDLYGGLSANQLTLDDVDFTLAMDVADVTTKLKPKAQTISIKGKNLLNVISDSELDIAGKMSVTGDLALTDSSLSLHDVAGAAKPKAQGLTVKGALAVDDSTLSTTGTISAAALSATDSIISIAAQEGLAAQSLKLTRKEIIKGTPQDNILTNCDVYVNGSMSVAGNLQLQNSDIYMRDYSGKNKAKGLSVKGELTVGSGSMLSLTGALSAKNLTLENGSSLTLGSAKFSTVKVGGALTLKGEVLFDLGFTVTEKDVAKGKVYTLFSFKSLVGDVSNLTLDYDGVYTLELNTKKTAILLTVKDAAAWNAYVADVQEALKKDEPKTEVAADESSVSEETVDAEDLLLKPVAAAAELDPLLAKAADTLVQSTWGTVGASRAFGETIASRGRNATLLGEEGKGAAWLSVMGGSSRISSAEGHNGADFTLSGAAFGVESRVGEKSTLGVAIGNSWGKVSTFSAFPVDQDSMHVGIYGNHALNKSWTLSWMATHTRTESEATILGAPYSWSQDALQLDARLTWGKSISEKTSVSAFAGLQYLATDSGECAGIKTGSLQNLRAELGVGASHKCSESTLVFGELSFIGDMVRNNPTAAIGDERTHGTNPGRMGLNLSVGAQHQLSEDWSLNASYSLELMENSTSHSLNVGASYSF